MLDLNLEIIWKEGLISRVDLGLHGSLHSADPQIQAWIDAYLLGEPQPFPFPLAMNNLTKFTQIVLNIVKGIPFGSTKSYGQIACELGSPGAARAVGSACGRNPFPLFIPCHRVVGSGGIGGFALDLKIKERLLVFEMQRVRIGR